MSYLLHLECYDCGKLYDVSIIQTFCPICQAPLLARYDLEKARQTLDRNEFKLRPRGMWRWREILPVFDEQNMICLGKGIHLCCCSRTWVPNLALHSCL